MGRLMRGLIKDGLDIYSETNAEIGPELSISHTWTGWSLSKPRLILLLILWLVGWGGKHQPAVCTPYFMLSG